MSRLLLVALWITAATLGLAQTACARSPAGDVARVPECPSVTAPGGQVAVRGAFLTKDGADWVPKGVNFVGLVAPRSRIADLDPRFQSATQMAADAFGRKALLDAQRFGSDIVRFQFSQAALDPNYPKPEYRSYDPNYRKQVVCAMRLARSLGLVVIMSAQHQPRAGNPDPQPAKMPDETTLAAFRSLAPDVGGDRGILFEFNEPAAQPTDAGWAAWQGAFQNMINGIRAMGLRNVIIAESPRAGRLISAAPPLSDPTGQLAYGVHPYELVSDSLRLETSEDLDQSFGNFCRTHACLATEWMQSSRVGCYPDAAQYTQMLLGYLRQRHIGLLPWAWDQPLTIRDQSLGQLTDWAPSGCVKQGGTGPGKMLEAYFGGHY